MQKELPNIIFNPKENQTFEIEIITIQDLRKRQKNIAHNPEELHQLKFNLIAYYTKGETKHFVDFVWHDVSPNTAVYVSKGQVNAFKFNENLEGFIILFTEDYFKKQLVKLPENEIIRFFNSNLFSPKIRVPEISNFGDYINLFFNEFSIEKDTFNKLNIYNALFVIIISKLEQLKQYQTFYINNTDKLDVFLKFKDLLESNYVTSRNAKFYASKLNITYKHLNVICKDILDITAKGFIDEFIILEAKRNLINSTIKSNELAYKIGFKEPTNFVKYFKKHTGLTPNSFKNNHNKE